MRGSAEPCSVTVRTSRGPVLCKRQICNVRSLRPVVHTLEVSGVRPRARCTRRVSGTRPRRCANLIPAGPPHRGPWSGVVDYSDCRATSCSLSNRWCRAAARVRGGRASVRWVLVPAGLACRWPPSARRTPTNAHLGAPDRGRRPPCEHCNRLFYCSARCRAAHRRRARGDVQRRRGAPSGLRLLPKLRAASCHTQLLAELVARTMLAPHTAAHGGGGGGGGGGSGGGGGGSGSGSGGGGSGSGGGGSGSGGRGGGGGGGSGGGGAGAAAAVAAEAARAGGKATRRKRRRRRGG